jgi:hypothetical protein
MNLVKNILNRQINGKLKFIKGSLFFKKNDWRYYYNILIIDYITNKYNYNSYKLNNKIYCFKCNNIFKKYIIDIYDYKDNYLSLRYNYIIDSFCINCN